MKSKFISFNSRLIFLLLSLTSINNVTAQNKLYSESKQYEIYQKMYNDYSNLVEKTSELKNKYLFECSNQKLLINSHYMWKQECETKIKEYSKDEKRYNKDLKKMLKDFEVLADEVTNAIQESIDLCANVGESKLIKSENELQNLVNIRSNYYSAEGRYDEIKKISAELYKYLFEFKNSKEFKKENCESYLVISTQYADDLNKEIIYVEKFIDSNNVNFKKLPVRLQQLKIGKNKEGFFEEYRGFITKDTNLEYGKPLSTEAIKNEIATIRKTLNCYNEVTYKRTYHNNKKTESEGYYWGDKKSGNWSLYYSNGKINAKAYYLSGKLEGGYYQYDEDGTLSAFGNLKDDERTGQWTFVENNIISIGSYKNDEQDGVWKEYYNDETLKSSSTFVNGDKVGWAEEYLPNGSLTEKGNYKKGEDSWSSKSSKQGIWNYWDYYSNGQLYEKETIDEDTGFNIGDYESYYENGDLQEKGKYINNKREGEWYFYVDFKKNNNLRYLHEIEGKYKVIFKNGKPIKYKDVNSQFDSIEN